MITLPEQLIKKVKILGNTVRYSDIPAKKSLNEDTAIFFIAGQKSPLERFFPMSEYFAQFYRTYGYEIPGMGLEKRNPKSEATINELSEEIAVFLNTVVKEKNIIVIAASAGFWFTTQALLTNPHIKNRVKKIIAVVGMLGKNTFGFSLIKKAFILAMCKAATSKPGMKLIDWLLSKEKLVALYAKHMIRKRHLSHLPADVQKEYEEFEKFLLKIGDWKIHFSTVAQYLTTDVTADSKIEIPMLAFYSAKDQFFPLENQKKTFQTVYTSIEWEQIILKGHAPLVVKNFNDYKNVIPEQKILDFLNS